MGRSQLITGFESVTSRKRLTDTLWSIRHDVELASCSAGTLSPTQRGAGEGQAVYKIRQMCSSSTRHCVIRRLQLPSPAPPCNKRRRAWSVSRQLDRAARRPRDRSTRCPTTLRGLAPPVQVYGSTLDALGPISESHSAPSGAASQRPRPNRRGRRE